MERIRPAYELTVGSAFFAFYDGIGSDGKPNYEKDKGGHDILIRQMDIIKKLQITPDVSKKKIYASGIVYDVSSNTKGATAGLGAVALPREVLDKALGANVKGSLSYSKVADVGQEFSFGYIVKLSDDSEVYYLHPRCKLVQGTENHDTSDDSERDPEVSYDIEILPTDEGVFKINYFTKNHGDGKKPLSYEEFYKLMPYLEADIIKIPDSEQAAG